MHVKVIKSEVKSGQRKDGSAYVGSAAVVIFPDGITAAKLFIGDDVIDPALVVPGGVYDMYRDDKGYPLVFDLVSVPEGASK